MIKNIIWDFDGTLFNTIPAIARAFQLALAEFGFDIPLPLFEELMKVNMDHCISEVSRSFKLDQDEYLKRFRAQYGAMPADTSPPFPGAKELCRKMIARGGQNFIVTHRRRAGAVELLEHFGTIELFTDMLCGDDGFAWKPDPGMFNHLIEKHSLNKEETLAIGDRALDIQAGKAAGIQTAFFLELEDELREANQIVTSYTGWRI